MAQKQKTRPCELEPSRLNELHIKKLSRGDSALANNLLDLWESAQEAIERECLAELEMVIFTDLEGSTQITERYKYRARFQGSPSQLQMILLSSFSYVEIRGGTSREPLIRFIDKNSDKICLTWGSVRPTQKEVRHCNLSILESLGDYLDTLPSLPREFNLRLKLLYKAGADPNYELKFKRVQPSGFKPPNIEEDCDFLSSNDYSTKSSEL
ncbi:hypothetical protein IE53DRAFT_360360 [Violaceomyces palustris]|uniref:Uncharacterized protein n=1 Tax=Violaceomyces palustris TaxID=1673888 RepID=A0ACD0P4L9_9BASI|nr:hypothetical protein IE53DRAFT_360360 [Violaceomyces palustris]